jgi:RNA polymerase sigma-70 factor (ECF subfamily)
MHRVYEEDRALVARMRAGDQRAFDEFFNANARRLLAFVSRRSTMDMASVEDVVQNSLVKAVNHLGSYRAEAALFTWLTEICRHELVDTHRKAVRRPTHVSIDEGTTASVVAELRIPAHMEPESLLETELHAAAVMRTLQLLPQHYARALEAKYGDGLAVEAIANLLGLSTAATQSVLSRAREAFREHWEATPADAVAKGSPR